MRISDWSSDVCSSDLRAHEDWLEELLDRPDTRLVPVWRTRSFVLEATNAPPRAAMLTVTEYRHLVTRAAAVAFLGEYEGVAHLALDLSPLEEPELIDRKSTRLNYRH